MRWEHTSNLNDCANSSSAKRMFSARGAPFYYPRLTLTLRTFTSMALLLKSVAKMFKELIPTMFPDRSRAMFEEYHGPNSVIFPIFLVNKRTRSCDRPWTPIELLQYTLENPRSIDNVGKIIVTRGFYYITRDGEYEFLIFEIQSLNPHLTNYVQIVRRPVRKIYATLRYGYYSLDDTQSVHGDSSSYVSALSPYHNATSGLSFPGRSDPSNPTLDCVLVSGSGNFKRLLNQNGRSTLLATLKPSSNRQMTVEELWTLVNTVSQYYPCSELLHTRCDWYTTLIWGALARLGGNWKQKLGRGTVAVPWVSWHDRFKPDTKPEGSTWNMDEGLTLILERHQTNWEQFGKDLETRIVSKQRIVHFSFTLTSIHRLLVSTEQNGNSKSRPNGSKGSLRRCGRNMPVCCG